MCRRPWPGRWRYAPRPNGSSRSRTWRSRYATRTLPRHPRRACPRWPSRTRPCATDRGCPAPSTGSASASRRGAALAVTGSSGAGKSSLVAALLRYWPLEGGTLSLGGTDVARLAQAAARGSCALADQRRPDVRRHRALQPRPGPARRLRERHRRTRCAPRASRVGGHAARRARDPGRRGRGRALGRRAAAPGRGAGPARPRTRGRPRRAHQRARRTVGR